MRRIARRPGHSAQLKRHLAVNKPSAYQVVSFVDYGALSRRYTAHRGVKHGFELVAVRVYGGRCARVFIPDLGEAHKIFGKRSVFDKIKIADAYAVLFEIILIAKNHGVCFGNDLLYKHRRSKGYVKTLALTYSVEWITAMFSHGLSLKNIITSVNFLLKSGYTVFQEFAVIIAGHKTDVVRLAFVGQVLKTRFSCNFPDLGFPVSPKRKNGAPQVFLRDSYCLAVYSLIGVEVGAFRALPWS